MGVSPSLAERLGTDTATLVGTSIKYLFALEALGQSSKDRPQGGMSGALNWHATDLLDTDGNIIQTFMTTTPIEDGSGSVVARLCTFFEATEIRQTEAQLNEAIGQATEASRAKSRFLEAMSHEIRTPMNAILGFAQLLKLTDLDEKREGHVDAIISAGGSLMNLLTDLLDLSNGEAGRLRVEQRSFDLQGMISQVADWWQSSAIEKGLSIDISLDKGLPDQILSDPVRLQQVLNNFLSNALKYTNTGGIVLSVEELGRREHTSHLRFSVKDSGIGMTEVQINDLFKPFVQIESDFGKERGGWGLGLSICQNIASIMGAKIDVESSPGAGTALHFELNVEIPDPDVRQQKPDQHSVPITGLRILIAEDNPIDQHMIREILHEIGHNAFMVSNGLEAVEALINEQFDVVLMDVTMPELDGIGATQQIRSADHSMKEVPIVACSAYVGDDVKDRYRRIGISDFLPKPVTKDALQTVIERAVRCS